MEETFEDHTKITINAYENSEPPLWEIGKPQMAVANLVKKGLEGPVLDVGCGTGENAMLLAKHGYHVTALDPSAIAIERAIYKAQKAEVDVDFVVGNGLNLQEHNSKYKTIVDSGVFHIFTNEQRTHYLQNLSSALMPKGLYYGLCFSDKEPGDWGPRRVSAQEIKQLFTNNWALVDLEPSTYHIRRPDPVKAWLITAQRL